MQPYSLKQSQIEEIKRESVKIWETYDDTNGYATKKIDRVEREKDPFTIVNMFDYTNQEKLFKQLRQSTRKSYCLKYLPI